MPTIRVRASSCISAIRRLGLVKQMREESEATSDERSCCSEEK